MLNMSTRQNTVVLLLCVLALWATQAAMAEVYERPEDFINRVFDSNPPEPETLWLKSEQKKRIRELLGRDLAALRVRYWGSDRRTAWLLEEIGKEQPITTGIVINGNEIESIQVLIYRESRGYEVRHPFFTEQFQGAELTNGDQLSRNIDSISGATLSVNALKKLAKVALYLHSQTGFAAEKAEVSSQ